MKLGAELRAFVIAAFSSAVACMAALSVGFAIKAVATQHEMSSAARNPDPGLALGRKLFIRHCVECHGMDARGEEGPTLYHLRSGDRLRRQIIRDGISKEMPAYGRSLNGNEIQALLAYLRTLKD